MRRAVSRTHHQVVAARGSSLDRQQSAICCRLDLRVRSRGAKRMLWEPFEWQQVIYDKGKDSEVGRSSEPC